ncbi:MAG: DUF2321 domain-containing protein [Anaerovoracaceae bacterium]
MSNFYAHVCENGHVEIDYKRVREHQLCKACGGKLFDTCPHCGSLIKKWHYYGSVSKGPTVFTPPEQCEACGTAYPWVKA